MAGLESGNTISGLSGGVTKSYAVKSRLFDQINFNYYPDDNLMLSLGHRYLVGKNAVAFGGEYGIGLKNGVMASLFAEGLVGEGNFHGVLGGVRFYFGQKDKTLINRHREDDPTDWGGSFNGQGNGLSTNVNNIQVTTPQFVCTDQTC